jgi:septal ring factor EnvC (AmiA/AmiB activator)
MEHLLSYVIPLILGGGLFKGLDALWRGISDSKEKKVLTAAIGAKTPAEVESVSVATMTRALESAQGRITSLEAERKSDKEYYQGRIQELNEQLRRVREEMASMEKKLTELLAETHTTPERPEIT